MKRILVLALAFILLISTNSFAALLSKGFTHPEVGEYLTVQIDACSPSFDIYGFTFVTFPPSSERYRGSYVNLLSICSSAYSDARTGLTNILRSVEGEFGYAKPILFEYRGPESEFTEQLNALELNDKVEALLLLNGFEGVEGYQKLAQSGLLGEDIDFSDFINAYRDYEVVLFDECYPYRVMSFYFDEGDDAAIEYYTERYHFLKIKEEWKLFRVVKEYSSYYVERKVPIYGLSFLEDPSTIDYNFYFEPLLGFNWGDDIQKVETELGLTAEKHQIVIEDSELYRLPAKAILKFTDGKLSSITYQFDVVESYYASYLSSYLRYYDPIYVDNDLNMYWCNDAFDIKLNYHSSSPSIIFSPHKK